MRPCAGRIDGHFRTVGLSLKFHPSVFVVHSEGREDKQVHMYKEIIPWLWAKSLRKHCAETIWKLWYPGFKAALDFVTQVASVAKQKGFFSLCFVSVAEFKGRIMQTPSAHRFAALYLTLFGYLGGVYSGTVLMNSNAIKNLPGVFGSKGADTVSPSPRTSPSGGMGHKSADTMQVNPVRKSEIVRTEVASIFTNNILRV